MTLLQQIHSGGLRLCLQLGPGGVRRLTRFYDYAMKLKKRNIQDKHYYLQLLGVDPDAQDQGLGSEILNAITAQLEKEKIPLYLETENPENVPFYTKERI